ncbi:MAG: 1-phosphofructokinase [Clostridia bacterium]|nr:1-phosphofructokinase [Clostridia bacterium]
MILTVTMNPSIDKLYMMEKNEPGTVMRVKQVVNTAGGKGLNVSRVAALLGEKVTASGIVGGHIGGYFESLISGFDCAFTHVQSETRSCINVWDLSTGDSTEYLEPGAPVTQEETERFFADFRANLHKADVVTISGSLPKGAPADSYERLIRWCREAGKKVLLDTSGENLIRGVKALPDFVKPNTDELAQLLGRPVQGMEEAVSAAKELHRQGIRWVAVSLGAQGAVLVCEEGAFHGVPPQITPKNTVGCGDSMVAGFAASMARGMKAQDALRLAVAVSAANALTLSTGSYNEEDFQRLLPQVDIRMI